MRAPKYLSASPDKSEAGLRLRISFLFWLTIRGFPPPVRMVFGRLLVLVIQS